MYILSTNGYTKHPLKQSVFPLFLRVLPKMLFMSEFCLPECREKPKFNLSFGWDMNKHKSADFTRKDGVYAAELDGFSVQAAKKEADRQIRLFAVKADDLEWQRKKNAEELNLGKRLYEDTQKWYKDGIVSADDVLRAKTAYESILYKTNGTELDCLIYNIDLTLLFVNGGDSR